MRDRLGRGLLGALVVLTACSAGDKAPTTEDTGIPTGGSVGTPTGTPGGTTTPSPTPNEQCANDPQVVAVVDGATHTSMQAAVDAAPSSATVWVCPGVHDGSVVIGDDLVIDGLDAAEATELVGTGDPVITITTGSVELRDLTLTGGHAPEGGGVLARDATGLVIEDCVISDNVGGVGGGLLVGAAGAELTRTVVESNEAWYDGAGLAVVDGGTVALQDVDLRSNESIERGGGLYLDGATVDGGGSTTVFGNLGWQGAGARLSNGSTLVGLVLEANDAYMEGGGLLIDGDATVQDVEILSNDGGMGGGVWAAQGTLTFTDVLIDGNTAYGWGGGMNLESVDLIGTNLTVSNNTVLGYGGGIHATDGTITGGLVSGNTALEGAGLYLVQASTAVVVSDTAVDRNDASSRGGGLFGTGGSLDLASVSLTGNTATTEGGGLVLDGAIAVLADTCTVSSNVAPVGAGASVGSGQLELVGGSVASNGDVTTLGGGGVHVDGGSLTTTGTDFGEGATDNQPDDVWSGGQPYSGYGVGATLSCGPGGCVTGP